MNSDIRDVEAGIGKHEVREMAKEKILGIMLDCSRNAVMRPEAVKNFVEIISGFGYNALMLYTEDTFEVDGEPCIGYFRGRYTQTELKEIDEYCLSRGVELIPCIQTLAHLGQLFKWDAYREICDTDDILLIGEERAYELIERMIASVRKCFRSGKIHLGMDEAHLMGFGKYKDIHGIVDRGKLFTEHLQRVCGIARKYGFQPIIWSDMFFRLAYRGKSNGDYRLGEGAIDGALKERLPENLSLVYWDYSSGSVKDYEDKIDRHKEFGRDVWFAGGAWKWGDFHTDNEITIPRTGKALEACQNRGIDRILITLWGDDGNEIPAYAVLNSLFAIAQMANGHSDEQETRLQFQRLTGESYDDFFLFDLRLNGSVPKCYEGASCQKAMLFADPFLGKFDSTVCGDGREARAWKELKEKLLSAARRSRRYGYIFECYAKLCEVMELKHDLGYRTRKEYAENNLEALKRLLSDYDGTVLRIENYLEAFREMWYRDHKPFGFEIQELRFGGLMTRIKSCRKRLNDYISGKIERIEELEEPMLNHRDGSKNYQKEIISSVPYRSCVDTSYL